MIFLLLVLFLLVNPVLHGKVFIPDIYITNRLREDGELRKKIKPLFFEHIPSPGILKTISDKVIPQKKRTSHKYTGASKVRWIAREKFGAKTIKITTEDNFDISALYFEREDAPINVIYVTGYFEDATPLKEWCAPFAAIFPKFNILSFDWRGFGQSTGSAKRDFGTNAYKDVLAAVKFMKEKNDKPTILVGFCMGGAMCLHALNKAMVEGKTKPDALVLNSPFIDFMNIIPRFNNDPDISIAQRIAINAPWIVRMKGNRLQGNPLDLKPSRLIKNIDIPCYVEHSTADIVVPIEEGISVFEKAQVPKMFTKSEIGKHVRMHTEVPYQYRNAFYTFLKKINFLSAKQFASLLR